MSSTMKKLLSIATFSVLAAGCANTTEIDEIRSMAQAAQQTADQANSTAQSADRKADRALQTANDAQRAAEEANTKIDRSFKESMQK